MIEKILLFILFISPLLGASQKFGYEQTKVLFLIAGVSIAVLLLLFSSRNIYIFFKWTPITSIAGFFFLSLVLTSLSGVSPAISAFGMPPYYHGFILYSFLFFFFLLVRFTKISIEKIGWVLVLSAFIVSVVATKDWILLHVFKIVIPTYAGRVISTFGQPNLYSGFVLLSIPFSFYLLEKVKKRQKIIVLFALFMNIVGIVISESRASIILATLLLVYYLFHKKHLKKIIIAGCIISVIALSFIFTKEVIEPLNPSWVAKNAPEKRLLIWQVGLEQAFRKPFFGYGLESFRNVYSGYFEQSEEPKTKAFLNRKNLVVDRTHNYILDLLVFSGIFGTVLWLLIIYRLFKHKKPQVLLVALVIYLIWVQFQVQSVLHLLYFWTIAGLIDNS